MISAKDAATAALSYFTDFYAGSGFSDIKVEEVELSDDNKNWLITLGYFDPSNHSSEIVSFGQRKFKIFTIDQFSAIKSMKIRSVE